MLDWCVMTHFRVLTWLPGTGLSISRSLRLRTETQIYPHLHRLCVFGVWETLPLVRLYKQVQVKVVHALLDVVPVGSDQFLVVVDLRLWRPNETVNKTLTEGAGQIGNADRSCTLPKRWLMMVSGRAWVKPLS